MPETSLLNSARKAHFAALLAALLTALPAAPLAALLAASVPSALATPLHHSTYSPNSQNQSQAPITSYLMPLPKPIPMLAPNQSKVQAPQDTFASLSADAVDDYKAMRYHACCAKLLKAIELKPNDAITFYRLGDVLTILKDEQGAKEAYSACFDSDPFGPVGRQARAKILAYAQRDAYLQTAPQDTPIVVGRTINAINRQSADLIDRYNREGQRWAQWRTRLGAIEARKIQDETNQRLAALRQSYRGGYYGNGSPVGYYGHRSSYGAFNPAFSFDQREMSNLGQINASYQQSDARVQGNLARIEASTKAAAVAECATNLKDQMMQPARPGDAKLKALGTNLYVRYYGDDTPSYDDPQPPEDPLQELHAKALSLRR